MAAMIDHPRWKPGMVVTCKRTVPAYYSGYGISPVSNFEPGMLGTIHDVVPPVTGDRKFLVIVDYEDDTGVRRCSLHPDNIREVTLL
jgi:hypothetical protein